MHAGRVFLPSLSVYFLSHLIILLLKVFHTSLSIKTKSVFEKVHMPSSDR